MQPAEIVLLSKSEKLLFFYLNAVRKPTTEKFTASHSETKKDANRHFENSYSTRNAAINNRTGRLGELATASYIVFRIEQVVAVVNNTKQPTTEQYKSVKTAVSVVQCFREVKIHMATDTDQRRYVGYMAVQSDFLVPQQNRPQTRAYSQL